MKESLCVQTPCSLTSTASSSANVSLLHNRFHSLHHSLHSQRGTLLMPVGVSRFQQHPGGMLLACGIDGALELAQEIETKEHG